LIALIQVCVIQTVSTKEPGDVHEGG